MPRKKSEAVPAGVNAPAAAPSQAAAEWSEKDHIAEPVMVAAQKLLEAAGSPELARQALATAARRDRAPKVAR